MEGRRQRREGCVRHLPECSVCRVHFTISGDQTEAAGLDSALAPLLLCQLGAASIHTGLREEAGVTGHVDSAGSRSLELMSYWGGECRTDRGSRKALRQRPGLEVGKQKRARAASVEGMGGVHKGCHTQVLQSGICQPELRSASSSLILC